MIRLATPNDAPSICRIYNHYVIHTVVTFEDTPVDEQEMAQRIKTTLNNFPWFVFEESGEVAGYAYANSWKSRAAYRRTVESTVYVDKNHMRKGTGLALYTELIRELKRRSLHSMLGGIALPNDASIALHEKLGFKKVGHLHEVGWKLERWIDVGYWELLL